MDASTLTRFLFCLVVLYSFFPETLLLNNNQLEGTIRDAFEPFNNLNFTDLSNNQLAGSIPSSLFEVPTLTNLYLNNNRFSGMIPANFGNGKNLRDLYLSSNQLTGEIPEIGVGQFPFLNEFLLEDNFLTGSMPNSICDLRSSAELEDLWTDCRGSPPEVECSVPDCCTACF